MTIENFDEKMMQRALGLVEGIAFGLGEGGRDVLLGAAEDIDSGIKALEKRAEEAEDDISRSGNTIHMLTIENEAFMKENKRLRDMLEQMATDGECDREGETENATGDNPSVACGDSSPYTGEPLGAAKGCEVCKGMAVAGAIKKGRDGFALIVDREKRLMVKIEGEEQIDFNIEFCPFCGRKL